MPPAVSLATVPQALSEGPLLTALLNKLEGMLDQVTIRPCSVCMNTHTHTYTHTTCTHTHTHTHPTYTRTHAHMHTHTHVHTYTHTHTHTHAHTHTHTHTQTYEINLLLTSIFSRLAAFTHPMVDWLFSTHPDHPGRNVYTILEKVTAVTVCRHIHV